MTIAATLNLGIHADIHARAGSGRGVVLLLP